MPSTCTTTTYGIETAHPPLPEEKAECKAILQARHQLSPHETVFLFNGALNYRPNYIAVQEIVQQINPVFLAAGFAYKILICGKGLPAEMNDLKEYAEKNIIYTGFVDNIDTYFKGTDVFLNPVNEGGGIKTKLIEALGFNLNAVSTINGAIGADEKLTNHKLVITGNDDWPAFANTAMNLPANKDDMPEAFYDHFYWGNIARKAVRFISPL